ncbi:MAG: PriCT-2 domain-containing protein, partial [Anaerolineae bacterium]|nr:PriCT-2 domain-containing protein [Anaerolineae bacterium]
QATGLRERRRHEAITHTTDQQEVADALRKIPAWGIDYDEWVAVLMALHREYGAAGLSMAESWAQGAQGEVERKWRSFKADGNPAGVVGLGTVFALAKRFGWERVTQ